MQRAWLLPAGCGPADFCVDLSRLLGTSEGHWATELKRTSSAGEPLGLLACADPILIVCTRRRRSQAPAAARTSPTTPHALLDFPTGINEFSIIHLFLQPAHDCISLCDTANPHNISKTGSGTESVTPPTLKIHVVFSVPRGTVGTGHHFVELGTLGTREHLHL